MNLSRFMLIMRAHKRAIWSTFLLTILTTAIVSLVVPKTYKSSASVVIDSQSTDPVTGLAVPVELMPGYIGTQVDIINSMNVAGRVADMLNLAQNPQIIKAYNKSTHGKGDIRTWLAAALMKNLDVKPSLTSNVIDISYVAESPADAAAITNAFVNAYMQENLDLKIQPAKQTADWYRDQLAILRQRLVNSQNKLAAYEKQQGLVLNNQVISSGNVMDTETARLNDLQAQLTILQTQTMENTSKSRNLGSQLAEVINNPLLQSIKSQLADSEAKLAQLATSEGKNNPEYQMQEAQVKTLQQKLADQTRMVRQSVTTTEQVSRQSEDALKAAIAAEKQKILDLADQKNEGAILTQEVGDAQRAFDQASQNYNQVRLQSQSARTDVSILNPADTPIDVYRPKLLINLVISIFVGGLLGIGLGMALELLDPRVRGERDLASEFGLPVLGVIGSTPHGLPRRRWFRRIAG